MTPRTIYHHHRGTSLPRRGCLPWAAYLTACPHARHTLPTRLCALGSCSGGSTVGGAGTKEDGTTAPSILLHRYLSDRECWNYGGRDTILALKSDSPQAQWRVGAVNLGVWTPRTGSRAAGRCAVRQDTSASLEGQAAIRTCAGGGAAESTLCKWEYQLG